MENQKAKVKIYYGKVGLKEILDEILKKIYGGNEII